MSDTKQGSANSRVAAQPAKTETATNSTPEGATTLYHDGQPLDAVLITAYRPDGNGGVVASGPQPGGYPHQRQDIAALLTPSINGDLFPAISVGDIPPQDGLYAVYVRDYKTGITLLCWNAGLSAEERRQVFTSAVIEAA